MSQAAIAAVLALAVRTAPAPPATTRLPAPRGSAMGTDTHIINAADQTDAIVIGTGAALGQRSAAAHDRLWLEQSRNKLVVDISGTDQKTISQSGYTAALTAAAVLPGKNKTTGAAAMSGFCGHKLQLQRFDRGGCHCSLPA